MKKMCNHLLAGREVAIAALLALFVSVGVTNDSPVLPPLPDDAFTVVIIPDTQHYLGPGTKISERGSSILPGMSEHAHTVAHSGISKVQPAEQIHNLYLQNHVDWIVANKESQNIVFVSHVGDIVEINRPEEWAVAKLHLDKLRGVVPFGLTVGNHDMKRDGDASGPAPKSYH